MALYHNVVYIKELAAMFKIENMKKLNTILILLKLIQQYLAALKPEK